MRIKQLPIDLLPQILTQVPPNSALLSHIDYDFLKFRSEWLPLALHGFINKTLADFYMRLILADIEAQSCLGYLGHFLFDVENVRIVFSWLAHDTATHERGPYISFKSAV